MESRSLYLNDYLIEEILVVVDTKTLHRSICVCKNWGRLISNSRFIKRFIKRSKSLPPLVTGFFGKLNQKITFCNLGIDHSVDTSLSFLQRDVHIVASDKGLVLCLYSDSSQFTVCNPLTKQCLDLPRYIRTHSYVQILSYDSVFFCYENRESIVQQLEFKVVLFRGWQRRWQKQRLVVDTYSSETRKWTESKTSTTISNPNSVDFLSKILFNEHVYFLAGSNLVISDLNEPSMHSLELPLSYCGHRNLGVSAGSLLYYHKSDGMPHCSVWVLVGGSEWSLKYNIDFLSIRRDGYGYFYHWGFHPLDSDTILLGSKNDVLFYNIDTRDITKTIHNFSTVYGWPVITYILPACLPCLTKTLLIAK